MSEDIKEIYMGDKGKKDKIKHEKQQKIAHDKKLKHKELSKVHGGQIGGSVIPIEPGPVITHIAGGKGAPDIHKH